LLTLAKSGYTEQEVIKALHSSREIKFKYNLLNKDEVKIGELTTLDNGNIIYVDSLAEIKRTASFVFKENETKDIDFLNDRIQPMFCLKMPNDYIEWSLGIFLLNSPTREENYNDILRKVTAYDSNLILKEDKFDNRYRIAANTNYINAINNIINGAGIRKINIVDNGYTLNKDKEFEIGTNKLEAINALLKEMNYTTLCVDKNGYFISKPYVLPTYLNAEYSYKNDDMSIIYNGAIDELDLFNVPNKWVVTASNPEEIPLTSIYVNNLPSSKTSIYSRGRTITKVKQIDSILNQQKLNEYTKKLAIEDSQVYGRIIFDTALMPHHSYNNILFIDHSDFGISTKYEETSWRMDLSLKGRMNHECRRVVLV